MKEENQFIEIGVIKLKFANLYWQDIEIGENQKIQVNIGDWLQFFAIDYIYSQMNMSVSEDIIKISVEEVKTYSGNDYLILPLNWSLFDSKYMDGDKIAISPKIIPVFLSMTLGHSYKEEYFNEYNINFFKKFEPIGCRDEITMNILRSFNINAYLNGCLTSIFPKRINKESPKKIILVDVPVEVLKYIPKDYLSNCEIMTQQYYCDKNQKREDIINNIKNQYKYYKDNARLIITSRLHVASPAVAFGIPTIFTKTIVDDRFSWLDKYIPLYSADDYFKINWKPKVPEYEEVKRKVLDNAITRIRDTYNKYEKSYDISSYFEERKRKKYTSFQDVLYNNYDKAIKFIRDKYEENKNFNYSIWGLGKSSERLYKYIHDNFPNAKLFQVIDMYKTEVFHGVKSVKPQNINFDKNNNIIVLPAAASNMAYYLFNEKKIDKSQYCICGEVYINNTKFM